MPHVKRIGILTAGGDCAGLNAVIRAVTKSALRLASPIEVVGIHDGYAGLVEGKTLSLGDADVSGILPRGGTILGTSNRDNPFKYRREGETEVQDRSKEAIATLDRARLDGLITVGGDGTLNCALAFSKLGVPIIGVPKTIDNDLAATDLTFGFDTARSIAVEAVDRLHSTAESHHRVLVCEVMGRNAGWIALHAGIAGGGDVILIPEIPYRLEKICALLEARIHRGKSFSIVVVAEGASEVGGDAVVATSRRVGERVRLGGISHVVAREIEERTKLEARVVVLGHLQRGGSPTAFDRWLATRYGVHAVELAARGAWGQMVALRGMEITDVPIQDAVQQLRRVDPQGADVKAAEAVGTAFGA